MKVKWWPEVNRFLPYVPYILVGTEIDLRETGTPNAHTGKVNPVIFEQAQALAKEIGCVKYMEVCAKDGRGIRELLDEAIEQVLIARGLKTSNDQGMDSFLLLIFAEVITEVKKKDKIEARQADINRKQELQQKQTSKRNKKKVEEKQQERLRQEKELEEFRQKLELKIKKGLAPTT